MLQRGVPIVSEFWPYGLVRAGTDCESYCGFMERFYRECWVYRAGRFIRYPIAVLPGLWEEKAPERDSEVTAGDTKETTVIFTN